MTASTSGSARPVLAMTLMVGAVLCFTLLDSIAKHLTATNPVSQIVWGRFAFNLVFMLTFVPKIGFSGLWRTDRPVFQIVRGMMLMCTTVCIVLAVKYLPLAETYAITFVSPFIVALGAAAILRERVSAGRWIAILVGFGGVLIVLRPGPDALGWVALFPFMMACFWAAYQIMTRIIGSTDPPLTTLFYTAFTATLVTSVVALPDWKPMTMEGWLGVAFMGAIGLAGQLALIRAYTLAEASLLSPLVYTQMVWATLFGFFIFGDIPDGATVTGAIVIIASGIFLVRNSQN